jgi:hypothetical protein
LAVENWDDSSWESPCRERPVAIRRREMKFCGRDVVVNIPIASFIVENQRRDELIEDCV